MRQLSRHLLGCLAACSLSACPGFAQGSPPQGPLTKEFSRTHRIRPDWYPLGATRGKAGFTPGALIPMHPVGFPSDDYNRYLSPSYAIGNGWQMTAALSGADRLGPGGEAIFYGFGVQRQFITETKWRPAVSLAGFGMTGPHSHHSGGVVLAASKKLAGGSEQGLFLHSGARLGIFDSDDYGSSSGLRPYVGLSVAFTRRFSIIGDYSPSQPWERDDVWSVRASIMVLKRVGLSLGVRNNGFDTSPILGVLF